MTNRNWMALKAAVVLVCAGSTVQVFAQGIEHAPLSGIPNSNLSNISNGGFGSASTQRAPAAPREDEAAQIYFRVCCQFTYDRVALYYTTDGSEPQGSLGVGSGTTQVITSAGGGIQFIANQSGLPGGTQDWWRATMPSNARVYGQQVRYMMSRWSSSNPGGTQFYSGGGTTSANAQKYEYTNKLAWPGQGSNFVGAEGIGYPPFWAWKEEGVVGNNFINAMLDQNGNIFDVYFPGAGGVQGVGTKNEGYVDGLDTFPAGLPIDNRGQMHFNQIMTGIRVGGVTSWLSNQNGTDFTNITQAYEADTQTLRTSQRLVRAGRNIDITQYDFSPKGVSTPNNGSQGILIKRMILKNNGASAETVNLYMYMDPAINGGDQYDFMLADSATGAMIAGDNQYRVATQTGSIGPGQEYNPTTFSGYEKNISLFFAAAMKTTPTPGGTGGTLSSDTWRDSSGDNGQGWIGQKVTLPPNQEVEVSFVIVGGVERPAGRDAFAGINGPGVFNTQMREVINWFQAGNVALWQNQTNTYWQNFLANGVQVETPDASLNNLYKRGLLATMLHFDERNGGLIAGFRNGAYPYVWPRDMAWAAVTLSRTGHTDVVASMTRYLRDITYRDFETWTTGNTPGFEAAGGSPFYGTRKGFWKQKYSTDGFVIWGAPQVDETAVIPWMIYYNYLVTGDVNYLTEAQAGNPANTNYAIVKDAVIAMSQTSKNDGTRLNHRQSYPGASTFLMYSNNVWEDSYDTFIMSNANIVRGLRDAAKIANVLGNAGDAADFTNRANGIKAGLDDKLNWNGENTDISLLGTVYPFEVYSPVDPKAVKIIDRINGTQSDRFGNVRPLVRFDDGPGGINRTSDYVDLIDRYWGDSYWGNAALGPNANGASRAGPWFLSTMWYGAYYALRQDFNPGKADIDNHYYRINRCKDHNGPVGFGAEQMAPSNALLYPGQSDFTLQTAWPNAWESMSFYVDSVMLFLDYTPDAPNNTLRIEPKLPSAWNQMTFKNLRVGTSRVDVKAFEDSSGSGNLFTNVTGAPVNFDTVVRIPAGVNPCFVTVGGNFVSPDSVDLNTGRVKITGPLLTGAGEKTMVFVFRRSPSDIADDAGLVPPQGPNNGVNEGDYNAFFAADGFFFQAALGPAAVGLFCDIADDAGLVPAQGPNNGVNEGDYNAFFNTFFVPCN